MRVLRGLPFGVFTAPLEAIFEEQVLPFVARAGVVVAAGVAGAYWLGRKRGQKR